MEDRDRQRLLAKVARLYHHSGLRQAEIADRLRISQTRVSRLLQQAEDRRASCSTVVVPLIGLNGEIEEELEAPLLAGRGPRRRGGRRRRARAHRRARRGRGRDLRHHAGGHAGRRADLVEPHARHMIDALRPVRTGTATVVEMLGDLGPPDQQHEAARPTQRLASLTGATPVFLRTPGVVASAQVREALLAHDAYARRRSVCSTRSTSRWWVWAPAKSSRRCRRGTTSSPWTAARRRRRRRRRPDLPAVPRCPGRARRVAAWTTSSPGSRWTSSGGEAALAVAGGPASTPRSERSCSAAGPTRS